MGFRILPTLLQVGAEIQNFLFLKSFWVGWDWKRRVWKVVERLLLGFEGMNEMFVWEWKWKKARFFFSKKKKGKRPAEQLEIFFFKKGLFL